MSQHRGVWVGVENVPSGSVEAGAQSSATAKRLKALPKDISAKTYQALSFLPVKESKLNERVIYLIF